jgi:hypothetical protein
MSAAANEKAVVAPVVLPIAIPVKQILPWAILGGMVAVVAYYFVGAEGGAFSSMGGMNVHEWVHDARHLLGFPCH